MLLHERLSHRVRRGVLLLAALAATAAIDGFHHIQHRKERYQFARQFSLQLAKTPRVRAQRLYEDLCLVDKPYKECSDNALRARLEDIPGVRWEYEMFLKDTHPDRTFRVWDFELPRAAYALAILYAPFAILLVIYVRLTAMSRIASVVRSEAHEGSKTQQRLNSVFSDRVTRRLGENRWIYSSIWTIALFLLCVAPPLLLLSWQAGIQTNTDVVIDAQGMISSLEELPRINRVKTDVPLSREEKTQLGALVLILLALAVLVWRMVVNQLCPNDAPESQASRRAA